MRNIQLSPQTPLFVYINHLVKNQLFRNRNSQYSQDTVNAVKRKKVEEK